MSYAVEMTSITKEFPGVVTNDSVTFQVRGGEIHALVGENGAGKTTLINVLYGLYHPDSGQIKVRGQEVTIHDPHQAIELGVGMVHQHFMLVPSLTVMENVVLGKTPTRFALTDARQADEAIMEISEQYSLAVNPRAKVHELPVGEMQRAGIVQAIIVLAVSAQFAFDLRRQRKSAEEEAEYAAEVKAEVETSQKEGEV